MEKMDMYQRRKNLKMLRVKEKSNFGNLPEEQIVKNVLKENLNIEEDMKFICHRLGRESQNTEKPRPILIKFSSEADRETVWRNKKMLKGSLIILKEDLPPAVEARSNALMPALQKARFEETKVHVRRGCILMESHILKNLCLRV